MIVFLLGSYVVFTSAYRFRIFLQYTPDDVPYTLADGCAWNVIEISSGVVSACLPTLVSLFSSFPLYLSSGPPLIAPSPDADTTNTECACQGPLVRDVFKSAWLSTSGAQSTNPSQLKGSAALVTIGGGGASNARSSRWKRIDELDEDTDLAREEAKYGLDLVPKHLSGRVEANVRASPTPMRGDTGSRGGGPGLDVSPGEPEGSGDEYPLRAIRRRTDVEWSVEDTGSRKKDLESGSDRFPGTREHT